MYIMWSNSGFVDQDIMKKVMMQFQIVWKNFRSSKADSLKEKNSLECFVLSDRLKVLHDNTLRLTLYNDRIHMWPLVAHSSYFDQPLDDLPYTLVVRSCNLEAEELTLAALVSGHEWKNTLLDLMCEIVEKRFTPEVIQKSFQHTNLWPWQKDEFLSRGKRLCGEIAGRETSEMEDFFNDFEIAVDRLRQRDEEVEESASESVVNSHGGAQLATVYDPKDLFLLDAWTGGESDDDEPLSNEHEEAPNRKRKKLRT